MVIGELDNSDNRARQYPRGLSLGGGIGGILYCKQSGSFYYYHYDGSGNVTSVTDGDGEEVAIYEYDSFGNVLTEAGSLANEFKFSTKQADKRGQLIDFGFRWYDPGQQSILHRMAMSRLPLSICRPVKLNPSPSEM